MAGVTATVGPERFYPTVRAAVAAFSRQEARSGVGPRDRGAHAARRRGRLAAADRARRSRRRWCSSRSGCWSGPRCSTGSTSRARARPCGRWRRRRWRSCCSATRRASTSGSSAREVGVPVRLLGIGLPLTIALGALAAAVIFGQLTLGEAVILGRRPGADRRRARAGGRDRAAHPGADPPGTQRRERAQRRDLRPAAVRGRRGRRRGIGDLRGPQRRRRCCSRRSATASSAASSAGSLVAAIVIYAGRRELIADAVAAGDPGRRRGAGLRDGRRARRVGLHRRVRRGHDVPARARGATPSTSTSSASRSGTCSTASPSCSSGPSCSDPRSAS